MVSLTICDGAYGIGGNKLYLEEGCKGVFLDFGKNFGKYGVFYEEMEIDFRRLWHWLKRFNIESCGFSLDENGDLGFERRYHASGHASCEDITWAIEQIDPDCIVPIHT